jgi:hypothetical protein
MSASSQWRDPPVLLINGPLLAKHLRISILSNCKTRRVAPPSVLQNRHAPPQARDRPARQIRKLTPSERQEIFPAQQSIS